MLATGRPSVDVVLARLVAGGRRDSSGCLVGWRMCAMEGKVHVRWSVSSDTSGELASMRRRLI